MEGDVQPALLEVANLHVHLGHPSVHAVRGLSFALQKGEIIGIAGESGSGKSVTALALTRLLPPEANPTCKGDVRIHGLPINLLTATSRQLQKARQRRIAYIFQEPSACFNPVLSIGHQLREVFLAAGCPRPDLQNTVTMALNDVGIVPSKDNLRALPDAFSGGMLQRLAIACAIAHQPPLLVADEPTTALDATTQKRIVDLLLRLQQQKNMAMIFISHDLALLKQIAHRMLILKDGCMVESGSPDQLLYHPQHPYTRRLVDAIPKIPLR